MGPKDPQGLQAYLGHLVLEDLVFLDPQGPQGPQARQPSWEQLWPFQAHLVPLDSQDYLDPET